MCETQKVDQPEHHHPANEGLLTDEEDAGEDEGEEEAEHRHHHSELEIVHQNSPNWNKYYLDNIYDGETVCHSAQSTKNTDQLQMVSCQYI